jgi:hypothetical protein
MTSIQHAATALICIKRRAATPGSYGLDFAVGALLTFDQGDPSREIKWLAAPRPY